ncbi:RagB/SusD family nutrient uptake outer membrane protein [Flavobacterium sp. Sd200]|uniref:RagB/SusD family nutrient uptake outer membrane protein n=1 Tax=Flavobacterium sp. Sd200 TaxID=2692211 RepID=UPI00136D01F5|nr:RagB/SusD family nutrient uptake outer membrane protein [Flavobacterium sp. Sd200]MXN91694.1 RagB/SusD family nutrient uptake outer membrane protein [Flavobacterium sp. Sd200]
MKKNKIGNYLITILLLAVCLLHTGCESFTEVDLPSNQLTAPAVFQDRATANAALAGVYAKIRDTGFLRGGANGIGSKMGCYADELDSYADATDNTSFFYTNSVLPTNPDITGWWADAYQIIYSANAIMEGTDASQALSQQDRDMLQGEALFIRALVHFYLVNIYGPIPYITTTDYRQNSQAGRVAKSQLYSYIIADLTESIEKLPGQYNNPERIRASKAVARALLARVYLFNHNWAEAAQTAEAVINDPVGFMLPDDLDTTFLKESGSTIWQLSAAGQGQNTEDGAHYIFTTTPPPTVALSEALMVAFEAGDLRKEHWTGALSDGGTTYYYANKYKHRGLTDASMEYQVVLRLAEQYLIRAEANLMLGNLSQAKQDIDLVRQKAGLAPTPAQSQQQLLAAILQERRVEFFTEGGFRFLDLSRLGLLDATLSTVKPGWDTTDALLPLPQTELLLNAHLAPQNPGY